MVIFRLMAESASLCENVTGICCLNPIPIRKGYRHISNQKYIPVTVIAGSIALYRWYI